MNVLQGLGNLLSGHHGQGGTLQVTVVQARKLSRKDVLSKSDPYCLLSVGRKHDMPLQNHIGSHYKTTVINNNEDPVWNQTFTINVKDSENELLRIKVYDYDHMTFDDLIGEVDVPLFSLRQGIPKDEWYQLSPAKGGAVRLILLANGFGTGGQGVNVNQMGMGMGMGMQAGGGMQGMGPMMQQQQPMMQQQQMMMQQQQPMMMQQQPMMMQQQPMAPIGYPVAQPFVQQPMAPIGYPVVSPYASAYPYGYY